MKENLVLLFISLGLSMSSDCTPSNCCKSSTNPAWEESWSSGLSSSQQTHWKLLGWDQSSWDGDKYNSATQKICYSALSTDQVNAVKSLCYDQSKWDAYMLTQYQANCDSSSSIGTRFPAGNNKLLASLFSMIFFNDEN